MIQILWTVGSFASLFALAIALFDLRRIRRDERELHDVERELHNDEVALGLRVRPPVAHVYAKRFLGTTTKKEKRRP